MAEKKKTFEQAMIRLEEIVTQLEKGEAPLELSLIHISPSVSAIPRP